MTEGGLGERSSIRRALTDAPQPLEYVHAVSRAIDEAGVRRKLAESRSCPRDRRSLLYTPRIRQGHARMGAEFELQGHRCGRRAIPPRPRSGGLSTTVS